MIEEFGESLINRFVSGMVVRIDPPNFATRCAIIR
jgi:chromosomal replication initiation ATPase DnaA